MGMLRIEFNQQFSNLISAFNHFSIEFGNDLAMAILGRSKQNIARILVRNAVLHVPQSKLNFECDHFLV